MPNLGFETILPFFVTKMQKCKTHHDFQEFCFATCTEFIFVDFSSKTHVKMNECYLAPKACPRWPLAGLCTFRVSLGTLKAKALKEKQFPYKLIDTY